MSEVEKTVLIVEDEVDARELLARSLGRAGYRVLTAGTVAEATRLIEGTPPPELVVSDLVLGEERDGGLRVLSALRAVDLEVPFVLITAYAALDTVKRALNEGASLLVEKPFRASELLDALASLPVRSQDMGRLVDVALARAGLTEKELAVARLVLKGLTSAEIARLENNSDKTVRQHLTRVYAKCGVSSRAEFFHFVFPW